MTGSDLWEEERHRVEISEDEDTPVALPGAHLDLPDHFSLPLTSRDPRLTVRSVKRLGDPLDTGSNKEQRTGKDPDESDLDMDSMDVTASGKGKRPAPLIQPNPALGLALYGLTVVGADGHRLDVSDVDRRIAIDFPNESWALFALSYNLGVFPQPSQHVAPRTDPFIPMDPIHDLWTGSWPRHFSPGARCCGRSSG